MGLDTTHDCWHGPYSSFYAFREAVAAAAKSLYDYTPSYQERPERAYFGWWDNAYVPRGSGPGYYNDPLDIFFVHSDCEGYIFPHDAQELIGRLEGILDHLKEESKGVPTYERIHWVIDRLARFIDGLNDAVKKWQIVEFR